MINVSTVAVCRTALLAVVCAAATVTGAAAQVSAPWTSRDIGSPALAGSATQSSGVFTINAAGADIWDSSDEFHFVYQAVSGDVDIRARVDSVTSAHAWSKAGVMIRESLNADAAHAMMIASAGKGLAFQRRRSAGAWSVNTAGPYAAPPRWVRLVRAGSTLTAYTSTDGASWTAVGSDTIALGATAYVGVAVTSHNETARTTARVSNVTVAAAAGGDATALPGGQSAADIGSPTPRGNTAFSSGTYTITAGGADIWDSADQFHFVYQRVTGNVEVVARVASIKYAHAWSRTGVMIRESLAANSRHASMLVPASSSKGYAFQRRAATGSWSEHTSGGSGTAPGWVRLVRSGDLFESYRSADGRTWTKVGSDSIPMSDAVYVGIATTSHNPTSTTTAVVSNLTVTTSSAANQPPNVSLTSPTSGAKFNTGATIGLAASASDSDGTIASVAFYSGSTLLSRDTTAPYAYSWGSVAAGTHSLTAVATDNDGATTTSSAVSVSVGSSNSAPTVSLTSPASGASFTAPASITVAASAADVDNNLSRVDFYANGTLIGSDTSSPYSIGWSNVAAGTYSLTAIARDSAGATRTSSAVSVTVTAATSTAPRAVTFTASPDHATLVTKYVLEIYRSGTTPGSSTPVATSDLGKPTPASNGDITVDRATFFQGLATGSYLATVTAVGSGGSARSTAVSFTR
jgi:regulation of enolase protein 1 (concanavalin A-like superfamily)